MATDKRLDQVSTLTDFDYALIVKGDQVAKASKQQLAELVGNLLYGATNASSLATVVAEQTAINTLEKTIPSNGFADVYVGRGLVVIDVDGGYQCVMCATSYWNVETICNVGDKIINISASSTGQSVTVTNLTDREIKIIYRRFTI